MSIKKLSITTLLNLLTWVPITLVIVIFYMTYHQQLNQIKKHRIIDFTHTLMHGTAPIAQMGLLKSDRAILQALIHHTILHEKNIKSMAFFDKNGHLLAYQGQHPPFFKKLMRHPSSSQHMTFQHIQPIRVQSFASYHLLTQQHLKPPPLHEILGFIYLQIDTSTFWNDQYQITIRSIFMLMIACLLIGMFHHHLKRMIYHPIKELKKSMYHILNHQWDAPLHLHSVNEFKWLEQGYRHLQQHCLAIEQELRQSLDASLHEIQKSHELLEEKNIQLLLDKRLAEEQYQQQSMILANLSHEIKTPLNGIIGFAELLLDNVLPLPTRDYAQTIRDSAQTLITILNDMLDYIQIDSKKMQLDHIPLDIRACIDDVFTLSAPRAHRKGLDLIPSTGIAVPKTVLGDPGRFKQIIRNLIDNAIKFTDHGHVIIRTHIKEETPSDYLIGIAVTDTGIGMTAQEQSHVFHSFQQANHAIFRHYGGSGLGLMISKQLAQQMKGDLVVESMQHQGTTFHLSLRFEKLPAYEQYKGQPHRYHTLSILCYDEHLLYLEALQNGLNTFQIQCIAVHEWDTLTRLWLSDRPIDLAFLDIHSENEARLRQLITHPKCPIIFTAKAFIPDYTTLGGIHFLSKPPNIQKLQTTLEQALQSMHHETLACEHPSEIAVLRQNIKQYHPNILIADDHPTHRMLIEAWLQDVAQLTLTEHGEAAVEAAHLNRFDIILLDMQMPYLDGLNAASKIHHTSLNHQTPMILISAQQAAISTFELQKNGITIQLEKPLQASELLQTLSKVLSQTPCRFIDWSHWLKQSHMHSTLATELIESFIHELIHDREALLQAIAEHNQEQFHYIAHKINGAAQFLKLEWLAQRMALFETWPFEVFIKHHTTLVDVTLQHMDILIHSSIHQGEQL